MFQSIQIKGNQTVPFDIHPDPHRCQHKWLGTATLHLGPTIYYPTCIFFEINESDIIFTLPGNSSTFYCFPREALLEYLTESAPHKMVLSFFPSSNEQDDALSDHHVMLSNVSHELSRAFKQVVYAYEMKCQNMMILFKRHEEQITHHKSEIAMLPETTYSSQSEKIHQDDSSTSSYDDVLYERVEKKKVKQDHHRSGGSATNKKCLYCGSKSTPMWRRGPQGAGTLCNACGVKWKHGKILNGNDPKPEKKRKRSNSNNSGKRKSSSSSSSVHHEDEGQQRFPSETSSTSDSPLESSPNTSPSELQKAVYHMTYLMDFDGNEMLEDAVEAAALLTLLKRS